MEGEFLYLQIVSARTERITVAMQLPRDNIKMCVWYKFRPKWQYMQKEIAYQAQK